MRRLGLPGKSVVPLLSSHACAVPGIMATRTIDNEKDRLTTMLVAPLTTCSARIPVYTLLIAAIVPSNKLFGVLNYQGLMMFLLYVLGIVSSITMAFVLKKTVVTGSASHLLLEIPGYRFPSFRNIIINVIQRVKVFIKKAGTIILGLSLIIWFLVSFPLQNNQTAPIEQSYAAKIGRVFTPLFEPIGFDWRLTTALIPSFGAREVVVSTLATVLSVQGEEGTKDFDQNFTQKVVTQFGVPSLISLLIWFVYSPQCISTIAIFRRESGGVKWTIFMVSYTFLLAYLASFIAYRIALLFY
jgi:ferrous iron transport protein B